MRIIAGEARGRRLFAPDGLDTRPTSDRVRESLFGILNRVIPDARVLDLFSGSGALGLEAISRGAAFATLVDHASASIRAIRRNVETVRAGDRVEVLMSDWRAALDRMHGPYDLVFLDPPYRMTEVYAQVIRALDERGLLAADAWIVMESARDAEISLPEGFACVDSRRYGQTVITMARREEAS